MKARDSVYDVIGEGTLELWSDKYLLNIYSMYNTGERSEPEKKNYNKIKTPLDPISYASNIHPRPHLWQISGGGGGPDPQSPPSGSAHALILYFMRYNFLHLTSA